MATALSSSADGSARPTATAGTKCPTVANALTGGVARRMVVHIIIERPAAIGDLRAGIAGHRLHQAGVEAGRDALAAPTLLAAASAQALTRAAVDSACRRASFEHVDAAAGAIDDIGAERGFESRWSARPAPTGAIGAKAAAVGPSIVSHALERQRAGVAGWESSSDLLLSGEETIGVFGRSERLSRGRPALPPLITASGRSSSRTSRSGSPSTATISP